MLSFRSLIICFIFLVLILHSISLAQDFGRLRGFVSDSTSGEVLPYSNAFIEELYTGASTDIRGQFLISRIPAGRSYEVLISYIGYESKTIEVSIEKDKITEIYVKLTPASYQLTDIEKVGEKTSEQNETDVSLQQIDVRKLELLPKSVEADIFRSLQMLPGVQSMGDVSGKYYVRGGASDQNLILLNGITIYNPYHGMGMFSVIEPDMINSLDFYKGGFDAQFGSRLSSVLNIHTKDGNRNRFSGKASLSYLSGKLLVEGPIPGGAFMLTGRKNIKSDILKKFLDGNEAPVEFYDYSYKVDYSNPDLLKNGKFLIFGFNSHDELINEDAKSQDFKWTNNLFGFQWYQFYDIPLYTQVTIASSNFNGEVIPNLSGTLQKKNELSDFSINFDLTYISDNSNEIGFGLQFKLLETKLLFQNGIDVKTALDNKGGNFVLYGKYKFMQWKNFGADLGVRINVTGISKNGGSLFPEPRVNLTYVLTSGIKLKGAWGIYQQEVATLTDERDVISLFEPYVIVPDYLEPSTSTHYIFGTELDVSKNLNFEIEGYYKSFQNLAELNESKIYSWDKDFVKASGESYGGELIAKYTNPLFSFTTSYALSWTFKTRDEFTYHPGYDSRHALNLILDFNLGAGWHAGAVWYYNSGRPFTRQLGYYDKLYPSSENNFWFAASNFIPFLILEEINQGRLPDYHRLDVSVSKKFELSFMRVYLDFSIINVYDRKNLFYFDRETGERINMLPFLPTATVKIEI
jgi:hypothetical protein